MDWAFPVWASNCTYSVDLCQFSCFSAQLSPPATASQNCTYDQITYFFVRGHPRKQLQLNQLIVWWLFNFAQRGGGGSAKKWMAPRRLTIPSDFLKVEPWKGAIMIHILPQTHIKIYMESAFWFIINQNPWVIHRPLLIFLPVFSLSSGLGPNSAELR